MCFLCAYCTSKSEERKRSKPKEAIRVGIWYFTKIRVLASFMPSNYASASGVLRGGGFFPRTTKSIPVSFRLWSSWAGRSMSWETALLSSGQNAFGCSPRGISGTTRLYCLQAEREQRGKHRGGCRVRNVASMRGTRL